jgi:hypothetical protein
MTATQPKTAVRNKKRTPTAHVGYRPAGSDLQGRKTRECYHAVADQDRQHGPVTCRQGDALCGRLGPWPDSPVGLFPPLVTCRWCRQIAASTGITIIGGDA